MDYDLSTNWIIFVIAISIWELGWKGFALWKAGRSNQPGWFLAVLILNTIGILPIIYIFLVNKNSQSDS